MVSGLSVNEKVGLTQDTGGQVFKKEASTSRGTMAQWTTHPSMYTNIERVDEGAWGWEDPPGRSWVLVRSLDCVRDNGNLGRSKQLTLARMLMVWVGGRG